MSYHHHDLAVRGTLNTIICSLILFDIQISALKRYFQLNKSICNNFNGDICIYPKYTYLQYRLRYLFNADISIALIEISAFEIQISALTFQYKCP